MLVNLFWRIASALQLAETQEQQQERERIIALCYDEIARRVDGAKAALFISEICNQKAIDLIALHHCKEPQIELYKRLVDVACSEFDNGYPVYSVRARISSIGSYIDLLEAEMNCESSRKPE